MSLFKLGRTRGTAANLPLKNDIDNHLFFFCVRVKGTVWKNEKYAFTLAIIGENSFQYDLVLESELGIIAQTIVTDLDLTYSLLPSKK